MMRCQPYLVSLMLAALVAAPCHALQAASPAAGAERAMGEAPSHDHRSQVPNGCQPLDAHAVGDVGCYIVAQEPLAVLPDGPLYLHIDTFADAVAARAVRGANGSVIQAYGRTWLLTIAKENWHPQGGHHVATLGPFTPSSKGPQLASYMVATTEANMDSLPHTHAGPEIFYVIEGAQCLETPDGVRRTGAGEGHVVAGGVPMKLYGAGDTMRRALVLVLHDAQQPVVIRHPHWQPSGACLAEHAG